MIDYTPKIKKEDLQDGVYYNGRCRNASVAVWDATRQRFYHHRTKFGSTYVDSILCPEDDDKYDVFVAESICENPEMVIDITQAIR